MNQGSFHIGNAALVFFGMIFKYLFTGGNNSVSISGCIPDIFIDSLVQK